VFERAPAAKWAGHTGNQPEQHYSSNITAAEAAILKHVDPAIYKVLRAKQKITPELNAHMQAQIMAVPLPINA